MPGWVPPDHWSESQGQLKKSGTVKLNASGQGTIFFTPDTARQRWVVDTVVVSTNQAFNAGTVPTVTLALNANDITTMSDGNNQGSTWSGNQDTFTGTTDVGPCDNFSVIFSPPSGQSGTSLSGVICKAVVYGVKYNRRA
jgi:hypothetical protein